MIDGVIIGKRVPTIDSDVGLFISPPGVDAETAPDNQLTLGISTLIPQMIMLGQTASVSETVPIGVSRTPLVLITSLQSMKDVFGYDFATGPLRPSPWDTEANNATATINGNGASMTITCALAKVRYEVYRFALT